MSRLRTLGRVLSLLLLLVFTNNSADAAVGRTQGAFNVSATGAATYQIPVWVPPGPKGIQPNLALVYDSRGGDGTVGPGWTLAGLSAVTRCNKTFAQDTTPAEVTLVASDGYCINGNRLRLISGGYGADGSIYQTEFADFSKIIAHGSATDGAIVQNGPAWFEVWGKDGLIYQYGNTGDADNAANNSRVKATGTNTAAQWLLNKVKDRTGNKYVVTYGAGQAGSTGIGVPLTLSYTPTNAGSTNYNYIIAFAYALRASNDYNEGYVNGTLIRNTNRLTDITVKSLGNTVRHYQLGYETSPTTGSYRLHQVQECSNDSATDCISPTIVGYQNGQAGGLSTTPNSAPGDLLSHADFNGDGLADAIYVDYQTYGTMRVAFGTGTGFGSLIDTGIPYGNFVTQDLLGRGSDDILATVNGSWYRYYWNGINSFVQIPTGIPNPGNQGALLIDLNGDGLPDLITQDNNVSPLVAYARLNTSAGGALSFSSNSLVFTSAHCNAAACSQALQIVSAQSGQPFDINGDGREDIVLVSYNYQDDYSCGEYSCGLQYIGETIFPLIWNGSALQDFGLGSGSGTPYIYEPIWLDFNGDHCTDISIAYINNCNGTFTSSGAMTTATPIAGLDWDSDGRRDLLVNNGGELGVYLSTSSGISGLQTTTIPTSIQNRYSVMDVDGDGLDDLVIAGPPPTYARSYLRHTGAMAPPDLMTSITDGYGVNYSPTYVSIARSNYTKGSGASAPEEEFNDSLYVVAQVMTSDGTGTAYTQTYNYVGARRDIQGRDFSGFQSVTMTDSRADAPKIITYYKTAFPFTGMVYQQDVYQHNGTTLISHTVNTPSTLAASTLDATANNQRYFPYVASTTIDTYEVGGTKNGALITQSAASFTYDSYGNVTSSTSTVTDKDSGVPASPTYNQTWTKVVTNTITPNTANWCLGIPTQVTLQQYATGVSSVTRTTSLTPDYVNCRITQQVVEPSSSSYKVTTGYGYDAFGNVNSQTVTGINMTARTTTANWGTTGQLPINTTNAEGHYTQAGYNYNLGVQTSQTDPNGLITSWTYDNFGRKLTETRPDGTSTAYSYNDCASVSGGCQNGDPAGSTSINKMVVIATSKDSSGTAIRDAWTYLDQFDRTIVTKNKTLSGGYTRVGVQYDVLGRAYHQTAPCDAGSCTVYWTTATYDALGRAIQQQRPISATNSTLQTTSIAYQGLTTITTDPQSKTTTKVTDPNGWLRKSMDHNGYYQSFTYDAFGSLKTVTDSSSNALFSASYAYGIGAFQTATTDMDLGTWGYTPNALGEVVAYTDAKASAFTLTYDKLSRPLTRFVSGDGTTTWTWGNTAASYNIGQLQSLTSTGATTENYTYDNKGRLSQKQIVSDATYNYNYAYNSTTGLLDTLTYPTSTSSYRFAVKYVYQNGVLQQVKDNAAGTIFWQANAMNPLGQITQETLGNGIVTNRSFDAVTGRLNSIQAGVGGGTGVQNEAYLFDKVGNLTQRQNNTLGLTESFYYDNLYRLDYSQLNSVTNLDMTYDALGRITNRTDVASNAAWTYSTGHVHQVLQAGSSAFTYTYDANGNAMTRNGQSITWNKSNYPTVINGSSTTSATISYDANNQRWKQVLVNGSSTGTDYFIGGLMEKGISGTTTEYRHYIYANNQPIAVYSRKSTAVNTLRYVLEDQLGSVAKITDTAGAVYVSGNFSAYGQRRNAATWSGAETSTNQGTLNSVTRNGFTWQAQLDFIGVIHMKGRVEDINTGIFLSADPYITEPGNTQNYNRYSYVYNNPLSFTDPSGYATDCLALANPEHAGEPSCQVLENITITASRGLSAGDPCAGMTCFHDPVVGFGGVNGSNSTGGQAGTVPLEQIIITAKRKKQEKKPTSNVDVNGNWVGPNEPGMTNLMDEALQFVNPVGPELAAIKVIGVLGKVARATGPILKTTKEAAKLAKSLGFDKISERVHGQAVFTDGKRFITRDVDGHNGGAWKMADSVEGLASKDTRSGTYDINLNPIGK